MEAVASGSWHFSGTSARRRRMVERLIGRGEGGMRAGGGGFWVGPASQGQVNHAAG